MGRLKTGDLVRTRSGLIGKVTIACWSEDWNGPRHEVLLRSGHRVYASEDQLEKVSLLDQIAEAAMDDDDQSSGSS